MLGCWDAEILEYLDISISVFSLPFSPARSTAKSLILRLVPEPAEGQGPPVP